MFLLEVSWCLARACVTCIFFSIVGGQIGFQGTGIVSQLSFYAIVRADSVRKYTVRFPKGPMAMGQGGLYTGGKFSEPFTRTAKSMTFDR